MCLPPVVKMTYDYIDSSQRDLCFLSRSEYLYSDVTVFTVNTNWWTSCDEQVVRWTWHEKCPKPGLVLNVDYQTQTNKSWHTSIYSIHRIPFLLVRFVKSKDIEHVQHFVYYESLKRELKTKTIYGFRWDERLETKVEESTLKDQRGGRRC